MSTTTNDKNEFYQIRKSPGDQYSGERPGYYIDVVKLIEKRDWLVGPFDTEKQAKNEAREILRGRNNAADKRGIQNIHLKNKTVYGSVEDLRKL